MKKFLLLCLFLSLVASMFAEVTVVRAATVYYVSPDGSNSNDGLSPGSPFENIQHAHDQTQPGDTVYLMDGTYYFNPYDPDLSDSSGNQGLAVITRSGSEAGGYITYKAYPGANPVLSIPEADNVWNGIKIVGASYIIIEGLEIVGDVGNITTTEATNKKEDFKEQLANSQDPNCTANCTITWADYPSVNTNGIIVNSLENGDGSLTIPHHIIIRDNIVRDVPGGGIAVNEADYATIEGNVVYNTSTRSFFANSGISLFHSINSDSDTSLTPYKNIIRNNVSYNNRSVTGWAYPEVENNVSLYLSDGNGIIVDDNRNEQLDGIDPYEGSTLVANNISFNNGGSGMHSFSSDNVDFVNNTTYNNGQVANNYVDGNGNLQIDYYSELFANTSDSIHFYNNVTSSGANNDAFDLFNTTNVSFDYNLFDGTVSVTLPNPDNNLYTDPQFVDAANGDLRLEYDSPGIDSGTSQFAQSADNQGNDRPQGAGYDRGAYEFSPAAQSLDRNAATATHTASYSTTGAGIDGDDSTAWYSGQSIAVGDQYQVDLGSSQTVSRVRFDSPNNTDYPHGFDIYVSDSPTTLGTAVRSVSNQSNPLADVSFPAAAGRYVTIQANTASFNYWAIEEAEVFTAKLDQSTLTTTAFASTSTNPSGQAIDGNTSSIWTSGQSMSPGQTFQIDMGSSQPVSRVVFGSGSTANYPRGLDVYVSDDSDDIGFPVYTLTGNSDPSLDLSFITKTGRYVTLKINTANNEWWAIDELNIFN